MKRIPVFFPFLLLVLGIGASLAMTPEARRSYKAFEQKAENGDSDAQYRLATILEQGWDSIPPDSARSLTLLHKSALAGYPPAMNYLGFLYTKGFIFNGTEGISPNRDSAIYWMSKSADMGDAKALSNVAYMLLNFPDSIEELTVSLGKNRSREREDSLAAEYLKRGAALGQPTALSMLGDLYRDGRGVKQDTMLAANCYMEALNAGLRDAEPRLIALMAPIWTRLSPSESFQLGTKYYSGVAPWAGVMLLKQASKLPDVPDSLLSNPTDSLKAEVASDLTRAGEALTLVADAISRGHGHRYNHDLSLEWFLKGALAGNPRAQEIVSETEAFFPDAFKTISDSIAPFRAQILRLKHLLNSD